MVTKKPQGQAKTTDVVVENEVLLALIELIANKTAEKVVDLLRKEECCGKQ